MEQNNEQQAEKVEVEWLSVTIPRTVGKTAAGKPIDSAHSFTGKYGEKIELKLPAHTTCAMPNEAGELVEQDLAFSSFVVRPKQVRAFENDPNYYSVRLPKNRENGDPATVTLRREVGGHWENPEAQGVERGKWIAGEEQKFTMSTEDFQAIMQSRRVAVREFASRRFETAEVEDPAAARAESYAKAKAAAAARSTPVKKVAGDKPAMSL